jgi:formylglycine-generating enzyme required for sulfatase activity
MYIGRYEITQEQWEMVAKMPKVKIDLAMTPSRFEGKRLPVELITWEQAQEFCERLSKYSKREYRLPSEAEWEYAARGGTTTAYAFGETITPNTVNYGGNYPDLMEAKGDYKKKTVEVGSLKIDNRYGLYDMHGNVWEWCEDRFHESYKDAPINGTFRNDLGKNDYRVLRGGSWYSFTRDCRSAIRHKAAPDSSIDYVGFRVVVSVRTLR